MQRAAKVALAVSVAFLAPSLLRADDYAIELNASTKETKPAQAKHPSDEKAARAVLPAKINVAITLKWTVQRTDKGAPAKDVLVHFFVVKQESLNQKAVPKLNKNVIVETALTMDFKGQDKTEGAFTFTVTSPGFYLLRLELQNTEGKAATGPFAALDLNVR